MNEHQLTRLVGTALRCYPARWRRRHGDEAAELATLLINDGTPAGSIALSYLAGAAREWLMPRRSRRLITVACALLVAACSLAVPAALLGSAGTARAASTNHAHGRAHCHPAKGRPQMKTREAGHDRSC